MKLNVAHVVMYDRTCIEGLDSLFKLKHSLKSTSLVHKQTCYGQIALSCLYSQPAEMSSPQGSRASRHLH